MGSEMQKSPSVLRSATQVLSTLAWDGDALRDEWEDPGKALMVLMLMLCSPHLRGSSSSSGLGGDDHTRAPRLPLHQPLQARPRFQVCPVPGTSQPSPGWESDFSGHDCRPDTCAWAERPGLLLLLGTPEIAKSGPGLATFLVE